jgi:hypothetical protein
VTGGLRYTSEHKDYTFVRQNWSGGPLVDPFGVGRSMAARPTMTAKSSTGAFRPTIASIRN